MKSIIKETAESCIEELRNIHITHGNLTVLKVHTPTDTYDYDPITFEKLPEPKHMTKYGILLDVE